MAMHIRQGEIVLKVVRRHKTPYVIKVLEIAAVSIPLYFFAVLIARAAESSWPILLFIIITVFLIVILTLVSIDYLADKLIITNKRVVWVNWISPISHAEHEAELIDIQDIETKEKGFFAKVRIFDYGFLEIETASSKVCIQYSDCPDPQGVKHFILKNIEKSRGGIHEKWEPPREDEWSVN